MIEMMEEDLSSADIYLIGGEKKLGGREMDEPADSLEKSVGIGLAKVAVFHDSNVAKSDWDRRAMYLKSATYPHPRRVIESRRGRSLDCGLSNGELAGEAREGALTPAPAEERAKKVSRLHEVGAPRLVRSRCGQQSRSSRHLPRARLKQKAVHTGTRKG